MMLEGRLVYQKWNSPPPFVTRRAEDVVKAFWLPLIGFCESLVVHRTFPCWGGDTQYLLPFAPTGTPAPSPLASAAAEESHRPALNAIDCKSAGCPPLHTSPIQAILQTPFPDGCRVGNKSDFHGVPSISWVRTGGGGRKRVAGKG